jgi:cysteine synthase
MGFFVDQFDNEANWRAHYATTGPEIWAQAAGHIDAVALAAGTAAHPPLPGKEPPRRQRLTVRGPRSAGTGGTLAGVSRFLKEQRPSIRVFLVDPPGSSLYGRVVHGVLFAAEEAEGRRRRVPPRPFHSAHTYSLT